MYENQILQLKKASDNATDRQTASIKRCMLWSLRVSYEAIGAVGYLAVHLLHTNDDELQQVSTASEEGNGTPLVYPRPPINHASRHG